MKVTMACRASSISCVPKLRSNERHGSTRGKHGPGAASSQGPGRYLCSRTTISYHIHPNRLWIGPSHGTIVYNGSRSQYVFTNMIAQLCIADTRCCQCMIFAFPYPETNRRVVDIEWEACLLAEARRQSASSLKPWKPASSNVPVVCIESSVYRRRSHLVFECALAFRVLPGSFLRSDEAWH